MARKFLYVVATLIVLTIAAAFAYRLWAPQLMRAAMVPNSAFASLSPPPANAYATKQLWFARPDVAASPALFTPTGFAREASSGGAATFYVHPTSFLDRRAWNAPLDDAKANELATLFVRGQASVFSGAGQVWAPRYRQATFGAFLTDAPQAKQAIDAAYADVASAFDAFLAAIPADQPIILAGHSQGALHLTRLLRERIAAKPLAKRIVAAYVIGWPISRTADLPALGLPGCATADQSGCILSWQSFAEPADPSTIVESFEAQPGLTGATRRGSTYLCVNPLTGTPDATAAATANLGTLRTSAEMKEGSLLAKAIPARCDAKGLLLIGAPPEMGPYVLPGNNYHVYDFSLFWANMRADANRRLAGFSAR